ncbi:MAG TPA: nitroreductase family protein [Acidimicrobiales bacterium]|nr:nitroreductase family protein [Acidimicrobiales bacterium]
MHLDDVIRGRRMVRSFTGEAVPADLLDALCDLARRAPSAGNSQGLDLLVLRGPAEVGAYWDVTLPSPRRAGFRWPGLVAAPALVLVVTDPAAYVARYGEDDKASTGLGTGADAWPVPYWWVDAGAAIEHLLLGAVDAGLGACLFGLFGHEQAVADAFGVPPGRRIVGTIALGRPAPDEPGRSARRPRRGLDDVIHRGCW